MIDPNEVNTEHQSQLQLTRSEEYNVKKDRDAKRGMVVGKGDQ